MPRTAGDRQQSQHVPADLISPSATYHRGPAVHHGAADLRREVDAHVHAGGWELPIEGGMRHHPEGGCVGAGHAQWAAESCMRRDLLMGPGQRV